MRSKDHHLDDSARRQLLGWARETLEIYLREGVVPEIPVDRLHPKLLELGGAFVTLHLGRDLRGCIGSFEADAPLAKTVRDMAIAAASRDPRFRPVPMGELELIHIEISVLSPRREVKDPLDEVRVGAHGIYISQGWHRGVLLPQVATEHGWDVLTFLQHTCLKAGLSTDAWQSPKTRVEVFDAQVFGEEHQSER